MTTWLQKNPEIHAEELLDLVLEHWDCLTGTNQKLWRALKQDHIRRVHQRQKRRRRSDLARLAGAQLGKLLLKCLVKIEMQVSAPALSCSREPCLTWGFAKVQLGDG